MIGARAAVRHRATAVSYSALASLEPCADSLIPGVGSARRVRPLLLPPARRLPAYRSHSRRRSAVWRWAYRRGMGQGPDRVSVPVLVGLPLPVAHDVALDAGLLAVRDREDPGRDTVTMQYPRPGHWLGRGEQVRIWTGPDEDPDDDDGGGGGGGGGVPPDPQPLTPPGTKPTPEPA